MYRTARVVGSASAALPMLIPVQRRTRGSVRSAINLPRPWRRAAHSAEAHCAGTRDKACARPAPWLRSTTPP